MSIIEEDTEVENNKSTNFKWLEEATKIVKDKKFCSKHTSSKHSNPKIYNREKNN